MSIPEDSSFFLEGMSALSKTLLYDNSKNGNEQTVQKALIEQVESAINGSVIDRKLGHKIITNLTPFKDKKIDKLSSEDKKKIQAVFDELVKKIEPQRTDSAYASAESIDSYEDPLEQAGFKSMKDISSAKGKSKDLQKQSIQALGEKGALVDYTQDGKPLQIKKNGNNYTFPSLKPVTELLNIEQKDLFDEDQKLEYPTLFQVDHAKDQRAAYMKFSISGKEPIVVGKAGDDKILLASIRTFIKKISSGLLTSGIKDKFFRVAVLFTTQYVENAVISPLLNVQRTQLSDMKGNGNFATYIASIDSKFDPVVSSKGQEVKDQFRVTLRAKVLTEVKPVSQSKSEEKQQAQLEARESLGLKPPLEGRVDCDFICSITPDGAITISDVHSKYGLTITA